MDLTLEQVKKDHPAIADALRAEAKEAAFAEGKAAGIAEGKKTGADEAAAAEKARVEGIIGLMPKGMESVCLECIKTGVAQADAGTRFLKELQAAAPQTPGPGTEPEKQPEAAQLTHDEQCKKDWEANPKLSEEYASLESYTGYQRAVKNGRVAAGKAK